MVLKELTNPALQAAYTQLQAAQIVMDNMEKELEEVKNSKKVDSILSYVQGYLYRPVKVIKIRSKCYVCDPNGMVRVKDEFFTRFKICDCQKVDISYKVEELSVISTSYLEYDESLNYDCSFDNGLISVNRKYVYDTFEPEHLNLENVFYKTKEDCEKFIGGKANEN